MPHDPEFHDHDPNYTDEEMDKIVQSLEEGSPEESHDDVYMATTVNHRSLLSELGLE